jgi:antitoxin ChpS
LAFREKIARRYRVKELFIFGSRARLSHHDQSDAGIAIILSVSKGTFLDAKLEMADWAVEVLLEKGVLNQSLPLWEFEWESPEIFANSYLIENIKAEEILF